MRLRPKQQWPAPKSARGATISSRTTYARGSVADGPARRVDATKSAKPSPHCRVAFACCCGWLISWASGLRRARPKCPSTPCAMWHKPNEDRKEAVRQFLAGCTDEQAGRPPLADYGPPHTLSATLCFLVRGLLPPSARFRLSRAHPTCAARVGHASRRGARN